MKSEPTPRTRALQTRMADEHRTAWESSCAYRELAYELEHELEGVTRAFPHCEEHKPDGGTRGGCLVCALIKLSAALSRIDYLCGEPNEMQTSGYDVHCDEEAVIRNVKRTLEDAEMKLTAQLKTAGEWLAAKDAEIDRLSVELKRAQEALRELVRLKDLKEKIDPVATAYERDYLSVKDRAEYETWLNDYKHGKPLAWDAARAALADGELERRIRDNYNDPRVATMIATAESNSDTFTITFPSSTCRACYGTGAVQNDAITGPQTCKACKGNGRRNA